MEDDNIQIIENTEIEKINNPKIYSKGAIWSFSFLFSAIFGAVLLMQNLKDIGKKKEGNKILLYSIIFTIFSIIVAEMFSNNSLAMLSNIIGGLALSEVSFRIHFPNSDEFEKKPIWKPLIIAIILMILFTVLAIYSRENNL